MKASLVLVILGLGLSSCNNEASVTLNEDSLRNEAQRGVKTADSLAEAVKDSVRLRSRKLKEEVEKKLETPDSIKK